MNPFVSILWVRALYAEWALQHVPPLLPDGGFNEDYQQLSNYANDRRVKKFFERK